MKKVLIVILVLCFTIGIVGCTKDNKEEETSINEIEKVVAENIEEDKKITPSEKLISEDKEKNNKMEDAVEKELNSKEASNTDNDKTSLDQDKKEASEKTTTPSKTSTPEKDTTPSKTTTPAKDTTKPTISGVTNKSIEYGKSIDLKSGVTAKDNVDGDITSKISVSGTVDSNKAGDYKITYSISDKAGNKTTASRTITVKAKPRPKDDVINFEKYPSPYTDLVMNGYVEGQIDDMRSSEMTYNGQVAGQLKYAELLLGRGNITTTQLRNELVGKVTDGGKYKISNVIVKTTSFDADKDFTVDEFNSGRQYYDRCQKDGLFTSGSGIKYDTVRAVSSPGNTYTKVYRMVVQFQKI